MSARGPSVPDPWTAPLQRPRIGISRCLLGDDVRYDGGHKRDTFLWHVLGPFVEWVPVCPELEVGMGVPREPIHLVADPRGVAAGQARVRLVGVRSATDWTAPMITYASRRTQALARMDLCGFVLKKDSPSCGMERVRVMTAAQRAEAAGGPPRPGRQATRVGRGLFAEALITRLPHLPVEEEGRLQDPALRENFVERVFARQRLCLFLGSRWTAGSLVRFHTAHKLQLLAHSRTGYRTLGRLVAAAASLDRQALARDYEAAFMHTLARPASPGRHADVMLHMLGHLKKLLDADDRAELVACIEDYRTGLAPRAVPVTLFRHHVPRHRVEYLQGQTYLDMHPRELALRR